MISTLTRKLPRSKIFWLSTAALAAVLLLGWLLRFQVTMSTAYPAGVNAAYYLVQARAVLETGALGLPDFPLLFYLHAALAGILSIFIAQEAAIMFVVRWTDALFPVLLAVPVFLFAVTFPRSAKMKWTPVLATPLVGLIAVANTSLLRMSGDFQKNAFALPLSLTFAFFLYQSVRLHRRSDYILAGAFFILTLLTHIGVAALTLTITALFAAINLFTHPDRKHALLIAGGLFLTVCLVLALVYFYDSARIERLLGIVFDPTGLLSSSADGPSGARTVWSNLWLGNLLGLIGIVVAIFHHQSLHPSGRALLWAASLTALFFASPFITGQWSGRLSLMAFLPGLIPLTYLVVRRSWGWLVALPVLALVLLTTLRAPNLCQQRAITEEAYQELVSIGETLPEGDNLVVAAHGLEWWVAWTMHTHISNRLELAVESWDDYNNIYIIEQLDPRANPSLGAGGPNRPGRQLNFPFRPGSAPDQNSAPGRPGASQPPNPNSPSRDRVAAQDTTLVYSGEFYYLSLLESKPETVERAGLPPDQGGKPSAPPDRTSQPPRPQSKTIQLGPLSMVPRPAWGAAPLDPKARAETGFFHPESNPNGILRYPEPLAEQLNTIIVHHTALPPDQGPLEIQQLHMEQRGYADIGYHFIISPDGTLYEGRRIELRGAHTRSYNTGTVGIVLQGNMSIIEPSQEQLQSLSALIDYLRDTYGITHLAGHHDFNPDDTECPGGNLHPLLPALAEQHSLTFGTAGYVPPPWLP